jgi:hypothetical protein
MADIVTFLIYHPARPEVGDVVGDDASFAEWEDLGWKKRPVKAAKVSKDADPAPVSSDASVDDASPKAKKA